MRTLLRLGSFCLLSSLAVGCTITSSDAPLDDAGDTGVVADDGTDTQVTDTQVTDTGTPETDAAPAFAVIIPANALVGGVDDDVRDYGGGSTRSDIVDGGRIWEAYGAYTSGSTTIESTRIGNAPSGGGRVDGRLTGLPTGSPVTITVTGYLRGLNGNNADAPNTRVPWARTTCTATPSATSDVTATCATKLAIIPDLKGIFFSSDVLPDGYCAGKGVAEFDILRARTPISGTATVSKTTNDCQGVIFVPESEFASAEVGGVSEWSLSLEPKGTAPACTLTPANKCVIDRKTGTGKIDIYVVGAACQMSNAKTGGTCF
jgi:hypothetical protein